MIIKNYYKSSKLIILISLSFYLSSCNKIDDLYQDDRWKNYELGFLTLRKCAISKYKVERKNISGRLNIGNILSGDSFAISSSEDYVRYIPIFEKNSINNFKNLDPLGNIFKVENSNFYIAESDVRCGDLHYDGIIFISKNEIINNFK